MSAFAFIFNIFWSFGRDPTVETENMLFTSLSGQAFPWRPLCHSCPHPSWASKSASSSAHIVPCVDLGLSPVPTVRSRLLVCELCVHVHVWSHQRPVFCSLLLTLCSHECPLLKRGCFIKFHIVQFSCSVVSDSLRPHEPQHARPPCPSPTPGIYPNSCPSSR